MRLVGLVFSKGRARVSSHLSITMASAGAPGISASARPMAATKEAGGLLGAFAALLDMATGAAPGPTTTLEGALPAPVAEGGADADSPTETGLLGDLVDLLAALDTALEAGEEPDAALLENLEGVLDTLAGLLGIPLDPAPTPLPVDAALPTGADGDATANLLGDRGEALRARLAALASALGASPLDADTLADIGADQGIEEALQALLARAGQKPAAAPARPLGEPALQLPELAGLAAPRPEARPASARTAQTAPDRTEPAGTKSAAPAQLSAGIAAMAANGGATEPPLDPDAPGNPLQSVGARGELLPGAKLVQSAYNNPAPQVNLPQIAFEIVRQVQAGNSRFQIRLDPPELGRIDVRLDIDGAGSVNARLTVERAETLDLLQRDQRALERALMQAGLDAGKTNLEFSLRQNPFANSDGQRRDDALPFLNSGDGPAADAGSEAPSTQIYHGVARAGGINLFV